MIHYIFLSKRHIFLLMRASTKIFFIIFVYLMSANNSFSEQQKVSDPLEPINRAIFVFNDAVDTAFLRPIATLYTAIPSPARNVIRNFLRNLETPVILTNNLLQGDIESAQITTIRFTVNTTMGILGLFDPATGMGFERKDEDFGQTLGVYGVKPGIFIVLPILGPSTIRDAIGIGVDQFFDPIQYATINTDSSWIMTTRTGVRGVDARANNLKTLDEIKKTSIDYYATLRSLYIQRRNSQVNNGSNKNVPKLDFEDEEDSMPINKPVFDIFEPLRD